MKRKHNDMISGAAATDTGARARASSCPTTGVQEIALVRAQGAKFSWRLRARKRPDNCPYKNYFVLVDANGHIKRPEHALKPSRRHKVHLSFSDSKGKKVHKSTNFRKMVLAMIFPEQCLQQHKQELFDMDGRSSSEICCGP